MTNEHIIMNASWQLMEAGVLKGSGMMVVQDDGTSVELPEPIHTYAGWKAIGRQVKKGEKAITAINIWKCSTKTITAKTVDGKETEMDARRMFFKKAFFFKASQTEPIKK